VETYLKPEKEDFVNDETSVIQDANDPRYVFCEDLNDVEE